jgi:polyisoprenoid-binding protein YceI
MRRFSTGIVIALALAAGACGKKKDGGGSASDGSGSGTAGSGSGSAMAGSGSGTAGSGSAMAGSGSAVAGSGSAGSGSGSAVAVDPKADYVHVLGHHNPAKDGDPVVVNIGKFAVVKATIADPAKLDGATAELSLDLTSIDSGMAKRDNHIMSPDLIDSAKFATATIKIDNVKSTGDKAYSADATASVHGIEKKLPVTIEVEEVMPDAVRVKGKATFKRFDFSIGKTGDGIPIADDQDIEIQLTLKKS